MAEFVTLSVILLAGAMWVKIGINDNISIENLKKREVGVRRNFYMNFNLEGGLGVDFIEIC